VPEPVSPRSRSRAGECDMGGGADVGQRCRTFTLPAVSGGGPPGIRTPNLRIKSLVRSRRSGRCASSELRICGSVKRVVSHRFSRSFTGMTRGVGRVARCHINRSCALRPSLPRGRSSRRRSACGTRPDRARTSPSAAVKSGTAWSFTNDTELGPVVDSPQSPWDGLTKTGRVRTLQPACGTGGMLSVAEDHLRELNPDARPLRPRSAASYPAALR
jgi:hypothetical protein